MDEIWFNFKSPEFGWLSNFDSRGSFVLKDRRWPTAEHYYQAQKFEDAGLVEKILSEKNAISVKKFADTQVENVRNDWEQVKEAVMKEAVLSKFEQNRKLKKMLFATGSSKLIHLSSSDTFWGRTKSGEGANYLGETIMKVRKELIK